MTSSARDQRRFRAHQRFVWFSRRWLPILIMLAPVLATVCALLMLGLILGVARLLAYFGLNG